MKPTHILLAAVLAATSAVRAATAEHKLPVPLPEFKTPEQLAKWREEKAKAAAVANSLSAIRDSQFFYTGKPYIEETGSYAFRFRQYNPELSKWMTTDPSGFPNGANNSRYAPTPTIGIDWQGLVVINSIQEALSYWGRSDGSSSDTVTAGDSIISAIKSCSGYNDLTSRIKSNRIQPQLLNVNPNADSGSLADGPLVGPVDIGFVDLVIGRSSISYSDSSTWSALTNFFNNGSSYGRELLATTTMNADFYDVFDFTAQANDPWWKNLIEETIPGWIAGPGTPFKIDGLFTDSFDTYAWQLE